MRQKIIVLVFAFLLVSVRAANADPAHIEPENTKAACSDKIDNDGDGHVDCDDQDCQDLVMCAPMKNGASLTDPVAERRGAGTTKVIAGAVMLPLGILLAGASAAPYHFVSAANGSTEKAYIAAGALLDVVGAGLIAAGGALLAIGSGQVAATAPTKHARIEPSFGILRAGASGGLRVTF